MSNWCGSYVAENEHDVDFDKKYFPVVYEMKHRRVDEDDYNADFKTLCEKVSCPCKI